MKCSGCVRFEERFREEERGTYHCCRQSYTVDKFPDDEACSQYWDNAEKEKEDKKAAEETERKRKKMWAVYASKPPVKVPIVFDGYGNIPECPVCHEMPYSTKQCHWCGQRFIQEDEIREYNNPEVVEMECSICGGKMIGTKSKYNGHFHGQCQDCGARVME